MALLFADSFDYYREGNTGDHLALGNWVTNSWPPSVYATSAVTRFGVGRALRISGNESTKSALFTTSASTAYISAALYQTDTAYFDLYQGGTVQMRIAFTPSAGTITFYRGTGTVVATYSAAIPLSQWVHYQIKVVFSATVGEVRLRKNGNTTDDFVATGLNTLNTATAAIDQFAFFGLTSYLDDLLIYDSSGSSFNTFLGDVRSYTLSPNAAGSAADFTANGLNKSAVFYSATGSAGNNGGEFHAFPFIATSSMSVAKIQMYFTGGTSGLIVVGLYADSTASPGNAPGARIASATAVSAPAGLTDFVFGSPPSITKGTRYWMCLISQNTYNAFMTGDTRWWTGYGYTDPMPANAPGLGTATQAPMFGLVPVSTSGFNTLQTYDGDSSYNSSGTVSAHDLFAMEDLPATPANIYGVVPRLLARKSDSGTRTLQTEIKSGATTTQGTATALGTSYGQISTVHATDPNTGSAWTATAVNALEVGYKVNS